jgi:type VI secretion system protein ImpK
VLGGLELKGPGKWTLVERAKSMSDDDDPFGLMDSDRTQFVRPIPGGRPTKLRTTPREVPAQRPTGSIAAIAGTPGRGPLVECAFGILAMIPLLRVRTPPAPPEQLRTQIESELLAFNERAKAKGLDQSMVARGYYALCALLDDVVLNTPWGAHSLWQSSSLTEALHGDAAAGEHFYDYLEQAERQPEQNRPVLELLAACLALGFEGQYRIRPNGQLALQQIRSRLLTTLRPMDENDDRALSSHWQGATAAHEPISRQIPLWVLASAAVGMMVISYAVLAIRLGDASDQLEGAVASLPPSGPVTIVRPAPTTVSPTSSVSTLVTQARSCLPEPSRSDPDAVNESIQGLRIRLPNAGLFSSGNTDLQASVLPTLTCLGTLLQASDGRVLVVGHSDNIPINTTRFHNNWELSRARAEAVAATLRPALGARVEVAGRAESEPIAANSSEDGRGRNRRVEILLLK